MSAGRNRRKVIVARVREEGAAAARAGRHAQTNPYKFMNAYQWLQGYNSVEHPRADCEGCGDPHCPCNEAIL